MKRRGQSGVDEGESSVKPTNPRTPARILTVNGGSSSIKFALFEVSDSLGRILDGGIERIGLPEATFRVKGSCEADNFLRSIKASDHTVAVGVLMDWIEQRCGRDALTAVGHRVVHGGPKYYKPQRITAEMVTELKHLSPFDPDPVSYTHLDVYKRQVHRTRLQAILCRRRRS